MNSSRVPVKNSGPTVTSKAIPKRKPRARRGPGSASCIRPNTAPNGAPASAATMTIAAVPSTVKLGSWRIGSGTPSATMRIADRAPMPATIPAAIPQMAPAATFNIGGDASEPTEGLVEALLAGADRDREPVLGWRQRAAPVVVVRAVRVVRAVEVEQVFAPA